MYKFLIFIMIYIIFDINSYNSIDLSNLSNISNNYNTSIYDYIIISKLSSSYIFTSYNYIIDQIDNSQLNKSNISPLFPIIISKLIKDYKLSDLSISFTNGRWNKDDIIELNINKYNISNLTFKSIKTSGVVLSTNSKKRYKLLKYISGILCAAISKMRLDKYYNTNYYIGIIPQENICATNVNAFFKFLNDDKLRKYLKDQYNKLLSDSAETYYNSFSINIFKIKDITRFQFSISTITKSIPNFIYLFPKSQNRKYLTSNFIENEDCNSNRITLDIGGTLNYLYLNYVL